MSTGWRLKVYNTILSVASSTVCGYRIWDLNLQYIKIPYSSHFHTQTSIVGVSLRMFICDKVKENYTFLQMYFYCCSATIKPPSERSCLCKAPLPENPSLLWLVVSYRPEQALPTMFLHQLCQCMSVLGPYSFDITTLWKSWQIIKGHRFQIGAICIFYFFSYIKKKNSLFKLCDL